MKHGKCTRRVVLALLPFAVVAGNPFQGTGLPTQGAAEKANSSDPQQKPPADAAPAKGTTKAPDSCTGNLTVRNLKKSGAAYDYAVAQLRTLLDRLDIEEAKFLGGNEQVRTVTNILIENGLVGVAEVTSAKPGVRIDAFTVGICSEVPDTALVFNVNGSLWHQEISIQVGSGQLERYPGTSPTGITVLLLHELAHQLEVANFRHDDLNDPEVSRANNAIIFKNFPKTIRNMGQRGNSKRSIGGNEP